MLIQKVNYKMIRKNVESSEEIDDDDEEVFSTLMRHKRGKNRSTNINIIMLHSSRSSATVPTFIIWLFLVHSLSYGGDLNSWEMMVERRMVRNYMYE